MKKVILFTSLFAVSTLAVAKGGFQDGNQQGSSSHQAQQGFVDESIAVKTVSEALKADDNTPVVLVGSITKQIDNNEFMFKDRTGEVEIEVKKRAWKGQTITPQDNVEIRGKVDKEWSKTEIEVHQVTKK